MFLKILCLFFLLKYVENVANGRLEEYFSWKQMKYDVYNIKYTKDSDYRKKSGPIIFKQHLNESERYFIQYNNVPIGLAVDDKFEGLFITVPRRRYGIIATVNSVSGHRCQSPLLTPTPEPPRFEKLISVYRPTIDRCRRLWMVDTGLLDIPDARKQVQPPSIVVIDLDSNDGAFVLNYTLNPSVLVNNRTSGGLTSITVEVSQHSCDDAYAYINDLATETLIVFSLKDKDSWSFSHQAFKHDPSALNFVVAGHKIPWQDGIFSTALGADAGRRKLYFHALASTKEFSVYIDELKVKGSQLNVMLEGDKGPNTQSGSHAFHAATNTLFFAGLAQDAILCWNVNKPLIPENVGIAAQDHEKLIYISDLKVVKDEVYVFVNNMPRFIYLALNPDETNFYVHRGNVRELIKGTPCEA